MNGDELIDPVCGMKVRPDGPHYTLGVPLAMGALHPFFGMVLSPMFAAAAMSLSSLSVIANSLRLR